MADTFNPVMKNCPVSLYGVLHINGEIQAHNIIPLWFTLPYILSKLGAHHIMSVQSNGYAYYRYGFDVLHDNLRAYYRYGFGDKEYDLRDKQQFLKLRDTVRQSYNDLVLKRI